MTVIVYTKPRCQPCRAVKRFLREREIPFEERSLEDEGNIAAAKALGHAEAPVVVWTPRAAENEAAQDVSWSGYRPDMLQQVHEERLGRF